MINEGNEFESLLGTRVILFCTKYFNRELKAISDQCLLLEDAGIGTRRANGARKMEGRANNGPGCVCEDHVGRSVLGG